MKTDKIAVIGLGLIGGSIAKTVKKTIGADIIGCDTNPDTLDKAKADGVISTGYGKVGSWLADCDLVFLCANVKYNRDMLGEIKEYLADDAILSDVSSVKSGIVKAVEEAGLSDRYIGGHPMAGSEKSGYENSTEYMFENAYFIMTPGEGVSKEDIGDYEIFLKNLKTIPVVMTPERHDYATCIISHFPHLIAYQLVNMLEIFDSDDQIMTKLAAGGFRDMTRIASSSPEMWYDICLENSENMIKAIDWMFKSLGHARSDFEDLNTGSVKSFFENAKFYRDNMIPPGRGAIDAAYEIFVEIVDETGVIATIATMLATSGISIKNIGIVHNREYEDGALHIEFYDEDSQRDAVSVLEKHHYRVYVRD